MDKVVSVYPTVAPAAGPSRVTSCGCRGTTATRARKKRGSSAPGVVHHAEANAFGVKLTVFRGPCRENLICAQSNDNLIDLVFEGLTGGCSQKVAGCWREFIMKDNREAVNTI